MEMLAKSVEYMQNTIIKKGFFPRGAVRCVAGQRVKKTPLPERGRGEDCLQRKYVV